MNFRFIIQVTIASLLSALAVRNVNPIQQLNLSTDGTHVDLPAVIENPYYPGKEVPCGTSQEVKEGQTYFFQSEKAPRQRRSPYWRPYPSRFPPHRSPFPHPFFQPSPFHPNLPRPSPYLISPTIRPTICKWTFKAASNCQLVANFEAFESGEAHCQLQYLLLGDEEKEVQICGFTPAPPGYFKSDGKELFIKHFKRVPAVWGAEFEGFLTCIKKYQQDAPILAPDEDVYGEEQYYEPAVRPIGIGDGVVSQSLTSPDDTTGLAELRPSTLSAGYFGVRDSDNEIEGNDLGDSYDVNFQEPYSSLNGSSYSPTAESPNTGEDPDDIYEFYAEDNGAVDGGPHQPYAETNDDSYAEDAGEKGKVELLQSETVIPSEDNDVYGEAVSDNSVAGEEFQSYPAPAEAPYSTMRPADAERQEDGYFGPSTESPSTGYDSYADGTYDKPSHVEEPKLEDYPLIGTYLATPYPEVEESPEQEYVDEYQSTPSPQEYAGDYSGLPYANPVPEPDYQPTTEGPYERSDGELDSTLNHIAAESAATLRNPSTQEPEQK